MRGDQPWAHWVCRGSLADRSLEGKIEVWLKDRSGWERKLLMLCACLDCVDEKRAVMFYGAARRTAVAASRIVVKAYRIALLILSFLLTAQAFAAAENVLVNGSFEAPALTPGAYVITSPTSWQGVRTRLINGDGGEPEYPGPQDGEQFVSLGNDSSPMTLSQAFTISVPGPHLLTW